MKMDKFRSSTPIRGASQRSLHEPGGSGAGGGSGGAGASGGSSNGNGFKNARNNTRELYQSHHYSTNNNLTTGTFRQRSNGNSSRSPSQYHQYPSPSRTDGPTLNGDNSLFSPPELRKQVKELQDTLSKVLLENEFIEFENEKLKDLIKEKDLALTEMRERSEMLIQTTCTLYEKLRQFKVRYYQEKNGLNDLFYDPPPKEDGQC